MTCIEFQKGLEPFFDNAANFETALEMQEHIEQCLACEGLFSGCLAIRRCLQNPDFRYRPAADLSHQIHRAILNEIDSGNRSRSSPLDWLSRCRLPNWLLPLAAVLVLWTGLTLRSPRISLTSDSGSGLVEQLTSNHLRSLIANHLMDVVSTDQHTVKPWFAGKLRFSPPVYDFTDQGFKLIGGRLDYLRKNEIAAVIYQHRQHYINLFVWPGQAGQTRDIITQKEGYNLYGWTVNGLTLWAVTDAQLDTLKAFVELEKERAE